MINGKTVYVVNAKCKESDVLSNILLVESTMERAIEKFTLFYLQSWADKSWLKEKPKYTSDNDWAEYDIIVLEIVENKPIHIKVTITAYLVNFFE